MIRLNSSPQTDNRVFIENGYTALRIIEDGRICYLLYPNQVFKSGHTRANAHVYTLDYLRQVSEKGWIEPFRPLREQILQYEDSLTND